jgi:hypothetical protein
MSEIFYYNEAMSSPIKDSIRVATEDVEDRDYHSSDISTFVNNYFIFYVPPPINRIYDNIGYYDDKPSNYLLANMSTIHIFSYENGATVKIEVLNATVINGTEFIQEKDDQGYVTNEYWVINNNARFRWLDQLTGITLTKKKIKLDEYTESEIQLCDWTVFDEARVKDVDNYRVLSGVIKITSDYPITVMHHKLHEYTTIEEDGVDSNDYVNYYWDGVFSFYGKKLFTRITRDCWISALDADTTVHVWDSDKNDVHELHLDRFEGWEYTRNAIFEQYGFDDDLVLISADKPVSVVAGLQADQSFTQVFGKDGRDFLSPCFGYVLIHAPNGGHIELEDISGNQGSDVVDMEPGEMRIFDFKVAYKLRGYSSFEWAELRSSEPVMVYTFVNNTWYLDDDYYGIISGEEYINSYKKTTEIYQHGWVPYPADTEFKIPIRSRAYVTIVNLDNSGNNINVDFQKFNMPYKSKLGKYETVTLDFSKDGYYPMDLVNPQTQTKEPSSWKTVDPYRRYQVDRIPRILVHEDDPQTYELIDKVSWKNITKGSYVKIKADHPVLVFIDYDNSNRYGYTRFGDISNRYQSSYPQGMDLIPGLTPPTKRGLPELPTWIVVISGMVIAIDMAVVGVGKRSMVEFFQK